LPNIKRTVGRLCSETPVKNGNETLKNGEDRKNIVYGNKDCGVSIENGSYLAYEFENENLINSVHITFDSDLNRRTLPEGRCEQIHLMRCNTKLDSPQFYVPTTLCKSFRLEAECNSENIVLFETGKNLKRAYEIPVNKNCKKLKLVPVSNWGDTDKTNIFSFDFK